ncbi:M23 family metallopeptidase [Brevundimonas sp. PAMC22021]|uniref:M23 family metallopeptidase n=1 Tax=Brevundimonas sp. PAMC22021 TaxID=2861285 RepID=UPI0021028BBF|nr:M23 family metallopeptidase [Brevundimonas sp. PAMC22021]
MASWSGVIRMAAIAGAAASLAACVSYPSEPRYSTRATPGEASAYPPPGTPAGQPYNPYGAQPAQPTPSYESPPPSAAPVAPVEGGALPPTSAQPYATPANSTPTYPPISSAPVVAGAGYAIQPGDTLSGVGRRFQTPVQTLIDLNNLGPRGAITPGQQIVLPDSAVDTGRDPYATGPSPVGVLVPSAGAVPPPPPPPSGNAALPVQSRPSAPLASAPTPGTAQVALVWPVRGEILRRFGPVGMGERNNGINIGASAGAEVVASAAGRVAYVGDDLVGQGLTVLIVHANGWRTVYGHLGSATVRDGEDVRQGQQIGTVGLTAGDGRPSIHYETRRMQGDDPVAVDPLTVLPR